MVAGFVSISIPLFSELLLNPIIRFSAGTVTFVLESRPGKKDLPDARDICILAPIGVNSVQ